MSIDNIEIGGAYIKSISGDSEGNIKLDCSIGDWCQPITIPSINIPNYDAYIKGIWDTCDTNTKGNEENMENNEILNLYYRRKRDAIQKEYDEKIREEYENLEVVKEYNDTIKEFETRLAEMADRYNTEETKYLVKTGYCTGTYKYELSNEVRDMLDSDEIFKERDEKLIELEKLVEEIKAQLSLSNDKDYQIEILKTYGVLDKKTGKLAI